MSQNGRSWHTIIGSSCSLFSQVLLKFFYHVLILCLQTCRFFSIDERLACYCGFPRCRGVVNDAEAQEQQANIYATPCELKEFFDLEENESLWEKGFLT